MAPQDSERVGEAPSGATGRSQGRQPLESGRSLTHHRGSNTRLGHPGSGARPGRGVSYQFEKNPRNYVTSRHSLMPLGLTARNSGQNQGSSQRGGIRRGASLTLGSPRQTPVGRLPPGEAPKSRRFAPSSVKFGGRRLGRSPESRHARHSLMPLEVTSGHGLRSRRDG